MVADRRRPPAIVGPQALVDRPGGGDAKLFVTGTARTMPPEQTLERVAPHLNRLGITRVGRISGLDRIGIDVFAAYRPRARSICVSQGKGATTAAAKVSAVMESLELWHAEQHCLPVTMASVGAFARSERIVNVRRLLRYHPHPIRLDLRVRWVEGIELLTGTRMWIPYEAVHMDFRTPPDPSEGVFYAGSNGLAAGNTLDEAMVHGICEVIERDASARSRASHEPSPRSVLAGEDGLPDHCREHLARFRAAGVDVVLWHLATPSGVPVFEAFAAERRTPWYKPLPQAWGSGAHLDPAVALSRAVTEVAQVRATLISACRDDLLRADYTSYYDPDERAEQLAEQEAATRVDFRQVTGERLPTAADDLRSLLDRLGRSGITQVVAVNLTHPEVQIPVVKIVIPGMMWSH